MKKFKDFINSKKQKINFNIIFLLPQKSHEEKLFLFLEKLCFSNLSVREQDKLFDIYEKKLKDLNISVSNNYEKLLTPVLKHYSDTSYTNKIISYYNYLEKIQSHAVYMHCIVASTLLLLDKNSVEKTIDLPSLLKQELFIMLAHKKNYVYLECVQFFTTYEMYRLHRDVSQAYPNYVLLMKNVYESIFEKEVLHSCIELGQVSDKKGKFKL